MEPVEYKMNLTCSFKFTVRARDHSAAIKYHKLAENFVFYHIVRGKPGTDPKTMDRAEVIFNAEIDQDSVEAERIWEP